MKSPARLYRSPLKGVAGFIWHMYSYNARLTGYGHAIRDDVVLIGPLRSQITIIYSICRMHSSTSGYDDE